MKLYYAKAACSLAPHIILEELGIPYETQVLRLQGADTENPEFLKLNPMGAVPVLVLDDGEPVTEVAVILQYLAGLRPELKLAPSPGTREHLRFLERLNFVATEIHKGFRPIYANPEVTPDKLLQEQMEKYWRAELFQRFDLLESTLSRQEYLMPWGFTVVDAYLFTTLNWTHYLRWDLSRWPGITAYLSRVKARPATQRAMKAERLF